MLPRFKSGAFFSLRIFLFLQTQVIFISDSYLSSHTQFYSLILLYGRAQTASPTTLCHPIVVNFSCTHLIACHLQTIDIRVVSPRGHRPSHITSSVSQPPNGDRPCISCSRCPGADKVESCSKKKTRWNATQKKRTNLSKKQIEN